MFEQDYKNAINKISPDAETKEKILESITAKENKADCKNPALTWRVAFACVACVAVVLGVLFVPNGGNSISVKKSESQPLAVSKSYEEIYRLIGHKSNSNYKRENGEFYEANDKSGNTSNSFSAQVKPGTSSNKSSNENENIYDDAKGDFSATTEQVDGVNEADIVKTDGEYIYYIYDTALFIVRADGQNSKLLSKTQLPYSTQGNYTEMFLNNDRLIAVKADHYKQDKPFVLVTVYDISNKNAPIVIAESCQEGYYNSSRMVGGCIYIVSNCQINTLKIDKNNPQTFVPVTETNGVCSTVPANKIYHYEKNKYQSCYTVIGSFDCKNGALLDSASLLGGCDNLYCSTDSIILAEASYDDESTAVEYETSDTVYSYADKTVVSRLALNDGKIEYQASGEIDGVLENQFFIDEYNGYFRFVTTVTKDVRTKQKFENSKHDIYMVKQETSASLTVLDNNLKAVSQIKNLAEGERVYSVRFMGDTAYFVTFRQTDPLFSADLSDPKNPKILGELKIPGFSEYMYPYTNGLLLGFGMDADESTGRSGDLKLSMFNISDPANVTEEDKTVVTGYEYSPALINHKAMLVSGQKNIIGFAASDIYNNSKYLIYKYTNGTFERTAVLTVNTDREIYDLTDIRGIFIKDGFYVLGGNTLQIFDMSTFLQVASVELQ